MGYLQQTCLIAKRYEGLGTHVIHDIYRLIPQQNAGSLRTITFFLTNEATTCIPNCNAWQ